MGVGFSNNSLKWRGVGGGWWGWGELKSSTVEYSTIDCKFNIVSIMIELNFIKKFQEAKKFSRKMIMVKIRLYKYSVIS